jgi:hypothetical protein
MSCLSGDGLLLKLGKLRPGYAMTHIVIAVCAGVGILLSIFLSWRGRSALGVILTAIALLSYGMIINGTGFGPGYLMVKLAPEGSWEPFVNYTFAIKGKVQGAELWINGVYLGKTPVKMTGRELRKKIPYWDELQKENAKQQYSELKGRWCKILLLVLEPKVRRNGGIWIIPEFNDYWAQIKLGDEWSGFGYGHCRNLNNDSFSYDYIVKLPAKFASSEIISKENEKRFDMLLKKASLSDYRIGARWLEAADTFGQGQLWKLRELSKREKGFVKILETLEKRSRQQKQDIDKMAQKDDDRKKKPSLADFLFYGDIESAVKIGGADVEKYLLRQYERDRRIEGKDIPYRNRKFFSGLNINKALYWLCQLEISTGRDFRKKHREDVLKLVELLTNTPFNHDRKPPEFLFLDIDEGKKSLAFQYWPKYFHAIEDSHPPWGYEKLKKRWTYLARLGSLATFDMYMDCWRQVTDLHELMGGNHLVEAVEAIPRDMRIQVAKAIVVELEKRIAAKRNRITSEKRARAFFDEHGYVSALKRHMASIGDEESLKWWVSLLKPAPNNHAPERLVQIFKSEKGLNHPLIKILAEHKDPDLRKMLLEAIKAHPAEANRKILEKLLKDEDYSVQAGAQEVSDYLEEIANIPLEELVSQPLTKEVRG